MNAYRASVWANGHSEWISKFHFAEEMDEEGSYIDYEIHPPEQAVQEKFVEDCNAEGHPARLNDARILICDRTARLKAPTPMPTRTRTSSSTETRTSTPTQMVDSEQFRLECEKSGNMVKVVEWGPEGDRQSTPVCVPPPAQDLSYVRSLDIYPITRIVDTGGVGVAVRKKCAQDARTDRVIEEGNFVTVTGEGLRQVRRLVVDRDKRG